MLFPVHNTYNEFVKRKVRVNTSGAGRCARRNVSTIKIAPKNIGQQIDFKKRQAQVDKSTFRKVLADPNSTIQHVEIWTDGAQGQTQSGKAVLGSGLRVVYDGAEADRVDMSWKILGVGTNNGAELAPIAKVAEWLKAKCRVTIYTDSDSSIKLLERIKRGELRDRDRINHPDRNAIMMIQQAMENNPGVLDQIKLVKVTSHTGVSGNEAADTCAGMAVRDPEASQYSTTIWIREALDYVLIDKDTGEPIMGNARKYMKQKQTKRRLRSWQDEDKYRVQGKFARGWEKIKGGWKRKVDSEILASRRMTKAINSIMLCQEEWGMQGTEGINKKWICRACGSQVGCAAHKINCAGAKGMCMAKMRGKWVERSEFQKVGREAPEWVKAATRKLKDGGVWYEVEGVGWVPSEILEKLAWGFDKTRQGTANAETWTRFRSEIARARNREINEPTEWERVQGEIHGRTRSVEIRELKNRPSPKWIMETLVQTGTHRELYTSAFDITPLMIEHHSKHAEDEVFGMTTGLTGIYRGATCSWINTTKCGTTDRCREILTAIKELNEENAVARHIAVVLGGKEVEQTISSNGGKIIAKWPEALVRIYESKWRTEEPRGPREWARQDKLQGQEIIMAVWQTDIADRGMPIDDQFFTTLMKESKKATGGVPLTRRSGLHNCTQTCVGACRRMQSHGATEGMVPTERTISHAAWGEIAELEESRPYIFWSARVGKLRQLNMAEPETVENVQTGIKRITVRVAGQDIERTKTIKTYKMAGFEETYTRMKESVRNHRRRMVEVTDAIEKDILECVKEMLECHWEKAGEQLIRDGKWTDEERREATKVYWDQRSWKRHKKK